MEKRGRAARRDSAGTVSRMLRWLAAFAAVALFALPVLALPAEDLTPDGATPSDRYAYPPPSGASEPVPSGWLRVPAAVFDVLVVRPVMAVGLVAGAGLSLVVLPFQAPASITDDTVETLADQTLSTFTRPLGQF